MNFTIYTINNVNMNLRSYIMDRFKININKVVLALGWSEWLARGHGWLL